MSDRRCLSGCRCCFLLVLAILVDNWPVESISAHILTMELFRLQEANRNIPRAVLLQKSMLKLLDERICCDPKSGKMIYA